MSNSDEENIFWIWISDKHFISFNLVQTLKLKNIKVIKANGRLFILILCHLWYLFDRRKDFRGRDLSHHRPGLANINFRLIAAFTKLSILFSVKSASEPAHLNWVPLLPRMNDNLDAWTWLDSLVSIQNLIFIFDLIFIDF